MTFGVSAGTIFSAVAPAVIGGIMGGGSGGNSATQTTQAQLDPRLSPYLYGGDGKGGLIGNVNSLYQQQAAQGGLNPLQNAGLELQRRTLMDPAYTQGFDAMRGTAMGLLGGAGNPFGSTLGAMPMMQQAAMGQQRNIQPIPGRASALGFSGASDPVAAAYQPIQQQTQAIPAAPMGPSAQDTQSLVQDMLAKYGLKEPDPEAWRVGVGA